jgi:hypothetical protein
MMTVTTSKIGNTLGAVVLVAFVGCGGSEKKSDPAPTPLVSMEEEEEYVDQEEEMIPDEKFNEIQNTFERKSSTVARCYPEAAEAGPHCQDSWRPS